MCSNITNVYFEVSEINLSYYFDSLFALQYLQYTVHAAYLYYMHN